MQNFLMQKNSVKALYRYQDWAALKQVTGFAAFSRNVSQFSAKVWKELVSWSAWYSQVLEGNGSKHNRPSKPAYFTSFRDAAISAAAPA